MDLDVVAVGNALVDVLSHEGDDFIVRHGLERGAMVMVDADTSDRVYDDMSPTTEVSGGSAANTAAGVASFGGGAAFIGKVRDDQLGKLFAHDLRSAGVGFDTPPLINGPAGDGPPTGRCLVVVTPDAERTMCTYLGAADQLTRDDVSEDLVTRAKVTYVEGYLWDQPHAKDAIRHVMDIARSNGGRVAFTLSDPFCVARHRAEFLDLIDERVDILFANAHEICSLFESDDFDDAFQAVRGRCEVAALTRSEHGSVVVTSGELHVIDPVPAHEVVDLTGAGDLYAAGFLFGLTREHDLATCGRLGSVAAAEVISHLGARPVASLASLATSALS